MSFLLVCAKSVLISTSAAAAALTALANVSKIPLTTGQQFLPFVLLTCYCVVKAIEAIAKSKAPPAENRSHLPTTGIPADF